MKYCIVIIDEYHRGRAAIEARSAGITIDEGEVVFRCNLVAIRDGKMWDYSSGHISTNEAKRFTEAEAKSTGFFIDEGYNIMSRLVGLII